MSRIQVVQKLAEGAVAEIFLAKVEHLDRPVVLKVLRPELTTDAAIVGRFLDETRVLQSLDHPNVVKHLGSGRMADGRVYMMTEYLEGEDLGMRLRGSGPIPRVELVRLVEPLAQALDYVHRQGIVHRDLKPDNVFLVGGLSAFAPKLLDFGLANFKGNKSVKTAEGLILSTPEYTPPECVGGAKADARSDLYSLGVLIYEALTGSPPFMAANIADLLVMHLKAEPPPLTGERALLQPIILRCLAKNPAERFSSAGELATALAQLHERWADRTHVSGSGSSAAVTEAIPIAQTSDEQVGQVFGNYELVRLLGEGAMGRVFQAQHTRLGRQVAMKFLKPEHAQNRDLLQRFFQEAKTVNQINHEHIVEIHDFVEETSPDGVPHAYCVMELLTGRTLTELLAKGPVEVGRAVRVCRQVADALGAAHAVGVVHRDVKPDNIFVTERSGVTDYVKVLDFGVAKLVRSMGDLPKSGTQAGIIIGTPEYMAPEQATGMSTDHRTDIYALGLVLYELLSGKKPFTGENFGQLVVAISTHPLPPLPQATSGGEPIPKALVEVVSRCLEKSPDARFSSMAELSTALQGLAVAPSERRPMATLLAHAARGSDEGLPAEVLAAARTRRVWPAVLGLFLLSGAAAGGYAVWGGPGEGAPNPGPAPQTAQEPPRLSERVRLELGSIPPGARVVRVDTQEELGETPMGISMFRTDKPLRLRFDAEGYEPFEETVSLAKDTQFIASLTPTPAPVAEEKPAPAVAAKKAKGKKKPKASTSATVDPFSN